MTERIVQVGTADYADLLARGWVVVAESFACQLDLDTAAVDRLARLRDSTVQVAELSDADVSAVLALDRATAGDYPGSVATQHPPLTQQAATPSPTRRGFGVRDAAAIVAMTWVDVDGDRAEVDFTVVAPAHRGRGLATQVKAASLLAFAQAGVGIVRTGGSAENLAILRADERLGFVVDERWATLAPRKP